MSHLNNKCQNAFADLNTVCCFFFVFFFFFCFFFVFSLFFFFFFFFGKFLGPVVQSIISLTSSLRVISLTVLADPIHNILFFAEKMWVAFALCFSKKKNSAYLRITRCKF